MSINILLTAAKELLKIQFKNDLDANSRLLELPLFHITSYWQSVALVLSCTIFALLFQQM